MDGEDNALEEGELSDDSLHNYNILERPSNYSCVQPYTRFPVKINDTESEDDLQSSESEDSDSDNPHKVKKPKIKLKAKKKLPTKPKKYDIWSKKLQEDLLVSEIDSIGVTKNTKWRDVESYDYTLASRRYDDERQGNKRTRSDRENNLFKQKKREEVEETDEKKGVPRLILDLVVNAENNDEEIAKDIANKLCEEKEDLISKVITAMGKQKAIDFFNDTKEIEAEGGMMIMNQIRRRTPGGVFLYLVRNDYHITHEQKEMIFSEERQRHKKVVRDKQKRKLQGIKNQIAASKAKPLPELLTRAEVLVADSNRTRNDTVETINPPPTPETDCHDNSGDDVNPVPEIINPRGKLQSYDDDFLDIGCSADMDLF